MEIKKTKQTLFSLLVFLIVFLHCHQQSLALSSIPNEALPTRSGYLPINPGATTSNTTNSSSSAMFYAFYEAQNSTLPLSETPLVIWLSGGPGCSSMIGNFFELGPYLVTQGTNQSDIELEPNHASWNRIFGVIFFDNPIGVGFSVAASPEDIPRDEETVGKHLYEAITGFIGLDASLFGDRPVYIAGESYAGKYVPAIGYYIARKNRKLPASRRVNLKGIAIGNGLTDPVTQVTTHASTAYDIGLINERQKREMEVVQDEVVRLIHARNWTGALGARTQVLDLLGTMTGLDYYNYAKQTANVGPNTWALFSDFLNSKQVKAQLGVEGPTVFDYCSNIVAGAMSEDIMKSVKHMVEYLLEESGDCKVLLFQGLFDLRDGVVSTEAWVRTLKWSGLGTFLGAQRVVWVGPTTGGGVAGYVQKSTRLSNVVIWGAGHGSIADQGPNAQVMVEDWVLDKGMFGGGT